MQATYTIESSNPLLNGTRVIIRGKTNAEISDKKIALEDEGKIQLNLHSVK